jgi:hypothetical protein
MTMKVTFSGRCCTDCLLFIANGDNESGVYERMTNVWTQEEVAHMVAGDEEYGFSWGDCDGCESGLGGERYGFAILE